MPKVPRRSDNEVRLNPLARTQAPDLPPADAFGGGPAAKGFQSAVSGANQEAQARVRRLSNEADELVVLEGMNSIAKREGEHLNGTFDKDGNQKTPGALRAVGKDTIDQRDTLSAEMDNYHKELADGMSSRQQRAFLMRYEARKPAFGAKLDTRMFSEMNKLYESEQNLAMATAVSDSVSAAQSLPASQAGLVIDQQVAIVNAMLEDWARKNPGVKKPAKKGGKSLFDSRKERTISGLHTAVINQYLADEKPQQAEGYFVGKRGDIVPEDKVKITDAIEEGTLRGEVQTDADELLLKHKSRGDALDEVARKNQKKPKKRKMLEDRVNRLYTQKKAIEEEKANELVRTAEVQIANKPNVTVRDALTPGLYTSLEKFPKRLRALEKLAGDPRHDDKLWGAMHFDAIHKLNETEFKTKYLAHFDRSHRERALNYWQTAVKAAKTDSTADKVLKGFVSDRDRVLNQLRSAKIGGISEADTIGEIFKSDAKARIFREVQDEVEGEYLAWEVENGKKPNAIEKNQIAFEVVHKTAFLKKAYAFDPEVIVATVSEDDRSSLYTPIGQIPKEDIAEFANIARSVGAVMMNETDEKIQIKMQDEFQRAHAAVLAGANDAQISAIMRGEQ